MMSDYDDHNDSYSEDDITDLGTNNDNGNGVLCALCDDGGHLISCIGRCKRSFHPRMEDGIDSACRTLGYTYAELEKMGDYLCENCKYNQHQCFKCGELEPSAEPNAKVLKCENPSCGYFYHPKCVAKLLEPDAPEVDGSSVLAQRIKEGLPFTCPMHRCFNCGGTENRAQKAMQLAGCRRCPKSYHIGCLPREISFVTIGWNVPQRAWKLPGLVTIYCLDHKISVATGSAERGHIKFPHRRIVLGRQRLANIGLPRRFAGPGAVQAYNGLRRRLAGPSAARAVGASSNNQVVIDDEGPEADLDMDED
ncbi:hypothetical protein U9M48_041143 [Paspalum notatum var. saurae]|uniref:Zinc finger PHD-type domain-containing protein n=1 Tax=Paspalum notatum var. saurae TaxID=547442 RepID=A0AAQ3UNK7_PASNO